MHIQGRYIPFTEEQKRRAKNTDIVRFLEAQGIPLKRSGSEYCWDRSKEGLGKITVRGHQWFDQYERIGNSSAIDFVIKYFSVDFPAAMRMLTGEAPASAPVAVEQPKSSKPFTLPERNSDMRRVYAYLIQKRKISREVISRFAHKRLLYEDAEHHNAVFVGCDEQGRPRHAHRRGTYSDSSYKGNVSGSRPQYSFYHLGDSNRLYVFEAPIDMLAYISLHPENWQAHSYVALCSVAAQGMEHILRHNPRIDTVVIGLDHDSVGIESAHRLREMAEGLGRTVALVQPEHKDFGEDIRAMHGEIPKPAGEHSGMEQIRELCDNLPGYADRFVRQLKPVSILEEMVHRLGAIHSTDSMKISERSLEIAGAAFSYAKDLYRRIGTPIEDDELADRLCERYRPHRDKGQLPRRMEEVRESLQQVKLGADPQKVFTASEMKQQIENVLDLSMDCLRLGAYVSPEPIQEQSMQLSM